MIGILDYGSGNVAALVTLYAKARIPARRVNYVGELEGISGLILPGVGAFGDTMRRLEQSGFVEPLEEYAVQRRKPVLGICVGMQILVDGSEEAGEPGLAWIRGQVRKIDTSALERAPFTPHMGWNSVKPRGDSGGLFEGVDIGRGFYFLHSYAVHVEDPQVQIATTHYGRSVTAAIRNRNIYGVQFHPEKSHSNGVHLLTSFARIAGVLKKPGIASRVWG